MRPRLATRHSRVLAGVVVVLLGIGSFLDRGPIGLGSGPLRFGSFSVTGTFDSRGARVGLVIDVINHGRAPAIINGVTLVGGGNGYPAPRLVTVYAARDQGCSSLGLLTGPAGQAVGTGCTGGRLALAGLAFPPSRKVRDRVTGELVPVSSLGLVAEASPPAPGRCWTVRAMAIHYRVGIRHYTATTPEAGAVCGTGVSEAQLQAAMTSAGG
jgi:hypothetical protein